MANLAYKRVSTVDQNIDRQLVGMEFDYTWTDYCSGSTANRPELNKMLSESASLRNGDKLHIHSIDRLARNLKDLILIITDVTNKGASIKFHKENLEFNSNLSDPIQKLMLQILGACSEFERSLILERQREGIEAAKLKGVKFGRPIKINNTKIKEILEYSLIEKNKTKVAKKFGISRTKLYQILKSK